MTKGQLVEQVYIHVNGGVLTEDAPVKWLDIANIIPAAYRKYLQTLIELRERANYRLGLDGILDENIMTLEEVMPTCENGKIYLNLTKRPVQLVKNLGLHRVFQGDQEFIKMSSPATVKGAEGIIPYYFWYTNPRVVNVNAAPSITSGITVQYIVDLEDLEEGEETNIPSGLELDIVTFCSQYFDKQTDSDKIINNNEATDIRPNSEGYMRRGQ